MAVKALVVYLGVVVMLALLQRTLIYLPDRAPRIEPAEAGLSAGQVHTVTLQTDDGLELRGWHVLPAGRSVPEPADAGRQLASGDWVVLYFSGNAGHRGYRALECETFTSLGCHVLLFDYRGYGDNPGSPTEAHLAADAHSVWQYATQTRSVAPSRVLLAGESLGGGVAVRLAAELCGQGTPPGGLILRSTFSSLVDVAAHHYPWLPVRWMMIDRFPSADRIPAVTCPILQLHGDRDSIVPLRYGQRLFAAAPERSATGVEKRFIQVRGADHNDILLVAPGEIRRAVREFLDRLSVGAASGHA
jgi:fermentation-respiration switch protein FrsA (DUF1100 family)